LDQQRVKHKGNQPHLMKDSCTGQTVICATAGEWGKLTREPSGLSLIHTTQPQWY